MFAGSNILKRILSPKRSFVLLLFVGLLIGGSSRMIKENSVIEGVLFEENSDGSGIIVRLHATDEIPWYGLTTPNKLGEVRLTLLNTRLAPTADLAESKSPLRSYRIFEAGSKVILEAVLDTLGRTVTLGPDASSHDLLMTFSRPPLPEVAGLLKVAPLEVLETSETSFITQGSSPVSDSPLSDVQRLFSSSLDKNAEQISAPLALPDAATERWRLDTVVLDAGHGGWDEGAFGRAGFLEKELALIIALRVGRLLEEQLGINVVYTRTVDRFIPVSERGRIANEAGGKLFISIHANYWANRQARGTETYFLGVHRSDSAKVVMERENRVVQMEEDTGHYSQYDNASTVQKALAQSSFMRNSEMLAEAIQRQFTDVVGRRDRGVKQAGFYVLFGASMPSVLIELGFLSNPSEEKFLSASDGQTSMANAIFRAVQNFKIEYEKSLQLANE